MKEERSVRLLEDFLIYNTKGVLDAIGHESIEGVIEAWEQYIEKAVIRGIQNGMNLSIKTNDKEFGFPMAYYLFFDDCGRCFDTSQHILQSNHIIDSLFGVLSSGTIYAEPDYEFIKLRRFFEVYKL